MSHLDESELVTRYRGNYGIPDDVDITDEAVHRHWSLERELTQRLLLSDPEERWATFKDCYTLLYSQLPWLDQASGLREDTPPALKFACWTDLMGAPPKKVYEVGSGRGDMARYLVSLGYRVRATEITCERGDRDADTDESLEWGITDGVHLDRFESSGSWDYVVSDQVLEHLHPDDLAQHLRAARALLVEGGEYILATPHRFRGPTDVSALFGADVACGMHLKEYTYAEMVRSLRESGYSRVRAVFELPRRLSEPLGLETRARRSVAYLRWALLTESIAGFAPSPRSRCRLMRHLRALGAPNAIRLVARK